MELSELTAYAEEKFHIREEHRWADLPGLSVLAVPGYAKWAALLMRQWDFETGTEIQRCDIRCGRQVLAETPKPYLSTPFRMKGQKWVGVTFGPGTEEDVVFRLFDRAVCSEEEGSCTIILRDMPAQGGAIYRASALPSAGSPRIEGQRRTGGPTGDGSLPGAGGSPKAEGWKMAQPAEAYADVRLPEIPERIRRMHRLYEYRDDSFAEKCRNFCRQGKFMEDYEDDAPWDGGYKRYFPTYHDLNLRQLRGYFTWRTRVRKGEFSPICASMAYLYLYELLNGIGTGSPEDALEKMKAFEAGFLDTGMADWPRKSQGDTTLGIRRNLRRWMLDYAVLHNLPVPLARSCVEPALLENDDALAVLRSPKEAGDEELFSALCVLSGKKMRTSPVVKKYGERGKRLFANVWRLAAEAWAKEGQDLFAACFGKQKAFSWHPLANAIYWEEQTHPDADYELDACRLYRCRDGAWQEIRYDRLFYDRKRLQGLVHEADRRLRRYLKTGYYLQENPEEAWAGASVEAAIDADRQAELEAARPHITIDLSCLEQIRQDALHTRDSLLVEEEPEEVGLEEAGRKELGSEAAGLEEVGLEEVGLEEAGRKELGAEASRSILPENLPAGLDGLHAQLLWELLHGNAVDETIKARRLMPSIVADTTNEALFDEIGDNILECDGSSVTLVEDYREEILRLLQWPGDKDR